jgi:CRISPR type III-B/RAMP module RAMP protein Cmr1
MIRQSYQFEILTPCFCGGAEPLQRAEIRAASIRGQLRWWFRVLGGFKSPLLPTDACRQEKQIFGAAAGESGYAGQLIVRVTDCSDPSVEPMSAKDLGNNENYLLFPLRETNSSQPRRGVFGDFDAKTKRYGNFRLEVLWRGNPSLAADIESLVTVFANLGALGFRSRRATGALTLTHHIMSLAVALDRFQLKNSIDVRALSASDAQSSIRTLADWLKGWRQHGQMSGIWRWIDPKDRKKGAKWFPISPAAQAANRLAPGFKFARRDHNEGLDVEGTGGPNPDPENPEGKLGQTFRPALGLPIIQTFSSLGSAKDGPKRAVVNWEYPASGEKNGRFASPVLLRPHRDAQGNWHALVIFVDAHKWPVGHKVQLTARGNTEERSVSLDLYEEMKKDTRLTMFLP